MSTVKLFGLVVLGKAASSNTGGGRGGPNGSLQRGRRGPGRGPLYAGDARRKGGTEGGVPPSAMDLSLNSDLLIFKQHNC